MKLLWLGLSLISIATLAQSPNRFRPGHFYDTKGGVFKGLISYAPNKCAHPFILFKASEDAKANKVKALKMKGFVVDKDSFAIVRGFTVEGIQTQVIDVPIGIAQVLEVGRVVLYKCLYVEEYILDRTPNNYSPDYRDENIIITYIVRQINTDRVMSVPEDQYDFNDRMSAYFQINPELANNIKSGAYSNGKVQFLVRDFNEWYASKKQGAVN